MSYLLIFAGALGLFAGGFMFGYLKGSKHAQNFIFNILAHVLTDMNDKESMKFLHKLESVLKRHFEGR